jgi:predicted acylesterase/phospholipase RssA/CRP-like cAMP-binding protein
MTSHPRDNPVALISTLRSTNVFREIPDLELHELARRMSVVLLADGDVLVEQGSTSEEFFVVLSGVVSVTMVDRDGLGHPVEEVGPGNLVGGMNVFSSAPAPATVTARGDVQLVSLSRAGFAQFTDMCPSGALTLMEALGPQLRRHRLWMALVASDMFRDVEPPALVDLESEFELVALYGGEVLFRQGDPGTSLYIVVSGRLRVVSIADDGTETLLAELGTGETVGEMAVISGEPRSATVYAARDTQLAKLSRAGVDRVVDRHPRSMLQMLTRRLVFRLRSASSGQRRRSAVATIAVVPASADVPLSEFSADLTKSLSRLGRTLHLTSDLVDNRCGRPGVAQAHDREGGSTGLLEWLAEQEIEHRYVVYQADRGPSPWTERCVRQADRIVLVADAAGDAAAGEVEGELLRGSRASRTPITLALLHADTAPAPSGTARWLTGRTLERHLHVRRDTSADYDRVARFVTGTAVGLTLGGGFARGLAHLGVLRALDELKIPVDTIAGSSMGAMIGAQWLLGWEPSRIVREISTSFAASFDDMTIPFVAFKRGGKASKVVRRFFEEVRIEDMWMPYFCVSANLNRSELKIHTSGRVADAVLASSRAPGIFPPIVIDGELHVDGGVINNVPVDIMKSFSSDGIVIGVDVSPPHELNPVEDYGDDVSGWRAIWHRFNPSPEKRIYRPSILLVLMRLIEFGGISYRREKAELADVYISPELLRFKRNDFHAAPAIVDAGYRAAREKLIGWLATAPESVRSRRPDLFQDRMPPGMAER